MEVATAERDQLKRQLSIHEEEKEMLIKAHSATKETMESHAARLEEEVDAHTATAKVRRRIRFRMNPAQPIA